MNAAHRFTHVAHGVFTRRAIVCAIDTALLLTIGSLPLPTGRLMNQVM
jgi:hypothetical protein